MLTHVWVRINRHRALYTFIQDTQTFKQTHTHTPPHSTSMNDMFMFTAEQTEESFSSCVYLEYAGFSMTVSSSNMNQNVCSVGLKLCKQREQEDKEQYFLYFVMLALILRIFGDSHSLN